MKELLKVLIVDDELMVRVGLSATIQWEQYGFQVIGACENGRQAISEINRCLPDVVFTDLKMPVMDGFELIRYIRENHFNTKIIVLSCLDEVEAVKNAIKMGADDYILKLSLSADGLKKLLGQWKETIIQDKSRTGGGAESSEKSPEKKRQFYSQILKNGVRSQQEEELFLQYSPEARSCSQFIVCCCVMDAAVTPETEGEDVTPCAIDNILDEFFQELPFYENQQDHPPERMILLGFPNRRSANIETILHYWNKINSVLKTHLNITCSCAVSQPFEHFKQLPKAYSLARERLSDCFFTGKESILLCPAESAPKKKVMVSSLALSLQSMIDNRNREGAEAVVREWFDKAKEESQLYSQYSIKAAVSGVWAFVSGYGPLSEEESKPEQLGENDYFFSFFHAESLEQLAQILLQAVDSLIEIAASGQTVHPEIMVLKKYIAEHVEEEISLAEAANRCCLNKTYFCSLFKKEVGETYNEYCERIKMERARVLLLSNHLKVYEIGLKVGIPNESYFSRRFKKYFGISPGQMRQNRELRT